MTEPLRVATIAELRGILSAVSAEAELLPMSRDALSAALDELERLRKEIPRLHAAGSRLANAVQYRRLQVDGEMVRIPKEKIDAAMKDCPFEVKT
jgi:hypothetical protein